MNLFLSYQIFQILSSSLFENFVEASTPKQKGCVGVPYEIKHLKKLLIKRKKLNT